MILFMKFKIIIFILLCFITKLKSNYKNYKIIYDIPFKESDPTMDIVVGPGGRYGTYTLGVCHYIKNNFDISNKKILGFSSGSWNSLFMCMKKEYVTAALKRSFALSKEPIPIMLKKTVDIFKSYSIDNFDIDNLYVATSSFNKTVIYNKFLSLDEVIRCCTSSSFIPGITYKDIIYFYKQRPTIDGGLHYKKYIKTLTPKTLVVNFKMFGRYKHINMMKEQFKKYKPSAYFLYIKGYQDAKKNHAYFEKYLN
jgi:hypothetical protein